MATRAAVERFAATNRQIRRLALADLRGLWRTLPTAPQAAAAAVVEFLPTLIHTYGDVSAVAAAETYEVMRADANIPGRYAPHLAPNPLTDAILINARWAVGPLFNGNPHDALARLEHVTDRMSLQSGRDTIDRAVRSDPARPRWARVPTGAETCAFCLMVASRGPVYGSERAAGGDANRYHAACDCTPTPIWPDDALPAGYDPDRLYASYLDAREAAGTGAPKAVLSELRKLQGTN